MLLTHSGDARTTGNRQKDRELHQALKPSHCRTKSRVRFCRKLTASYMGRIAGLGILFRNPCTLWITVA